MSQVFQPIVINRKFIYYTGFHPQLFFEFNDYLSSFNNKIIILHYVVRDRMDDRPTYTTCIWTDFFLLTTDSLSCIFL